MFSIRLLRADDATAFWILRQEALGSVPEAFGESVEERYRAGRVGEEATVQTVSPSPLVEPEVQISRVRLS